MTESIDNIPDQDHELVAAMTALNAEFERPLGASKRKTAGAFCIHNDQLNSLAKVTRILGDERPVYFEVKRDRLRASVRHGLTFTVEARLDQEATQAEGVRFALTCRQLKGLAQHFRGLLTCRFDPQENCLHIRCGRKESYYNIETLSFANADGTGSSVVSEDAHEDVDDLNAVEDRDEPGCGPEADDNKSPNADPQAGTCLPVEPRQVNVQAIKRALGLARRTARQDKIVAGLGVIEINDGIARGGTGEAVTLVDSKLLNDISLKIDVADVARVRSALHCMDGGSLCERDQSYEFAGEHIVAVIPKAKYSFPSIDSFREAVPTQKVQIRGEDLFTALNVFAPLLVRYKGKAIVEIVYLAARPDILEFNAIIPEQTTIRGKAPIKVVDLEPTDSLTLDLAIRVSLEMLYLAANASAGMTKLIGISMFERGVMLEEDDGDMRTRTYLAKLAY